MELDKETLVSLVLSELVRLHCSKTWRIMAALRLLRLLSSDVIVLNIVLGAEHLTRLDIWLDSN